MLLYDRLFFHELFLFTNGEFGKLIDLSGANLSWTNLSGANLSGANLSGANLSGADLTRADLTMADLTRADLTRADLTRADLTRADLTMADLTMADLTMADLTGTDITWATLTEPIARLDFGDWPICVRKDVTSIGCQVHSNEKWLTWQHDDREIIHMDSKASKWWKTHGDSVKSVIRCIISKSNEEQK